MTMRTQQIRTLCIGAVLLAAVSGCDITTEPKSTVGATAVFADPGSYEAFLAKLYGGLSLTGQVGPNGQGDFPTYSDEGFTQYSRQLWQLQELPTDEAVIGWGDVGLPELVTGLFSSSNQFVQMMYYRVFYQVALVNEFLRETTAEKLAERGHTDFAGEVAQYRAEARFLRALSYWHGLDLWGNIPLVDETFPEGATPPEQSTPEAIFQFIVDELTAVRDELPTAGTGEYGRADQGAVAMLLAKVYMNAEVYVGSAHYADAFGEIQRVLTGPYTIHGDYQELFLADNDNTNETIFAVPYDGLSTKTWGGTTFLAHAGCGGSIDPADLGLDFCWWGLRVKPELVLLFEEPQEDSPDSRAIFWSDGQSLEIGAIQSNDGYWGPKYKNITSDGAVGSNTTHPDTDFPMFRLADAYLMYAELALRGAGGSTGDALNYVNELRERAYGDQSGNITAGELTLDFVLDERARELWWEGHRRTDMIRFGKFTGGSYLWSWKANVQNGAALDERYALYPIPASELVANPNLTQNDGY
jgi:hypothetical protein